MLEEIKRLVKDPVLHMHNHEGRFHLYCYVGQYESNWLILNVSRGNYTAYDSVYCNCSSSVSLFFATLRWNN